VTSLTCILLQDDWTIIVATVGFTGLCIIAFILSNEEAATPIFSAETGNGVITILLAGEVVFQATCLVFKLSLTLFYRKFLIEEWQRWLVLACGFFYCSTCVVGVCLATFQCGLPTNLMHKHVTGQCVKLQAFTALMYVHGILSAVTDWIFALLPIATLYRSNLSRAAKISSSCLLLLACGGSIAAVARTATTGEYLLRPAYLDPNLRPNYYSISGPTVNLTVIELGLGITAVSLACLRPLLRSVKSVGQHFTSRLMGTDMTKSGHTDEEATVNLVVVDTKQMHGPVPTGSCWNRTPAVGDATNAPVDLEASWNKTPALGGAANPLEASWNQTPALNDVTIPPPSLGNSWSKTPPIGGGSTILMPLGSSFNRTPATNQPTPPSSLGSSFNRTPAIGEVKPPANLGASFNRTPPTVANPADDMPPSKGSSWKRMQRPKK
jgi:hypothetical protein